MSSYKIAVIGYKDSVIGFKALGLEAVTAANTEEARTAFLKAARNRDEIAIIYITEQFAAELKAEIEEVKGQVTPAVNIDPVEAGHPRAGDGGAFFRS
jgi:V/A-type H+-transporting ATPase subunit F